MVRLFLRDTRRQIRSTTTTQKIAYGGGNFVRCAVAKSAAY